jgi:hypothetical protein
MQALPCERLPICATLGIALPTTEEIEEGEGERGELEEGVEELKSVELCPMTGACCIGNISIK